MMGKNLETNAGLVKFQSRDAAAAYLEGFLEHYRAKHEEYGQQLAEHLRKVQGPSQGTQRPEKQDKKEKGPQQTSAKGWARVGILPVNLSDPEGALAQVTLRIVEDYKMKVEKITDALKSFKDIESVSQGAGTAYTLFIFRGVPEAVIVEQSAKKIEAFAFTASFRAV